MAQVVCGETKLFLKPPESAQSLHKSIKFITVFANFIGLLPVDGVTSNSVQDLNFKWISLKTLCTFFLLLQAFFGGVLHLISMFKEGAINSVLCKFYWVALHFCEVLQLHLLYNLFSLLFTCTSITIHSNFLGELYLYFFWLSILVAYFYLARKWPKLMKRWHEVDLSMERAYNYPSSLNVRFKVIATTAFVATAGIKLMFLALSAVSLQIVFAAIYLGFYYHTDDDLASDAFNRICTAMGVQKVYYFKPIKFLVQVQNFLQEFFVL